VDAGTGWILVEGVLLDAIDASDFVL